MTAAVVPEAATAATDASMEMPPATPFEMCIAGPPCISSPAETAVVEVAVEGVAPYRIDWMPASADVIELVLRKPVALMVPKSSTLPAFPPPAATPCSRDTPTTLAPVAVIVPLRVTLPVICAVERMP